ncbi:hypothetical protein NSS66_23675 [Paenibacillus sp. FSL R10-2748]
MSLAHKFVANHSDTKTIRHVVILLMGLIFNEFLTIGVMDEWMTP